jgi:hypothetical protein
MLNQHSRLKRSPSGSVFLSLFLHRLASLTIAMPLLMHTCYQHASLLILTLSYLSLTLLYLALLGLTLVYLAVVIVSLTV